MQLDLYRNPDHTKDFTAGRLYIDGLFAYYTLEDEVREVAGKPVKDWKIPKQTAIPRGTYRIILTKSPRFNRLLPELLGVPGFQSIRMHAGNTAQNTEGCILVGLADGNSKDAWLGNSRAAETALIKLLDAANKRNEKIYITIH